MTPHAVEVADLAISDGIVVEIAGSIFGSAANELDATGFHLLPGAIDSHVHFNEPGRTEWEGIATGSRALAAGGATTYVDMPLNSSPPTLTGRDFDAKLAAAYAASLVDFGFWGGLVAGSQHTMRELAARGVVGFKGFMCESGLVEFPRVDDLTLCEGMQIAAELALPILLHAEDDEITRTLTLRARTEGRVHEVRDYLATRPPEAEIQAIGRAIELADATGCALHIVHVSTEAGADLVVAAAASGVDVSCETCPQYLLLSEADMERLGAYAKCGPPPRFDDQPALWEMIADERIPMVVSDHSPSSADLKVGLPLLDCWGGISGCQSTLGLMLEHGHARRGMPLDILCRAVASAAATRFRLPGKGALAVGYDADIALVDLSHTFELRSEDLWYRHPQSAYVGVTHRGRVTRTLVRGMTVFADAVPASAPVGRLVTPNSPPSN